MQPEDQLSNTDVAGEGPGASIERPARRRLPVIPWALAGGLLAGIVAAAGGEGVHGLFRPTITLPPNWEQLSIYDKDIHRSAELIRTKPAAEAKNTALAFGMLGGALGAALGLAGGLARGAPRAGLAAALAGLAAGIVVGGVAAAAGVPLFFRFHDPEVGSLVVPTLIHALLLACLGAAGGLALGLGLGDRGAIMPAVTGGIAAALVGTILFEVALAILFPLAPLEVPIPSERLARVLMHLSAAVFIAAGAAWGVQSHTRRPTLGAP